VSRCQLNPFGSDFRSVTWPSAGHDPSNCPAFTRVATGSLGSGWGQPQLSGAGLVTWPKLAQRAPAPLIISEPEAQFELACTPDRKARTVAVSPSLSRSVMVAPGPMQSHPGASALALSWENSHKISAPRAAGK
jgi:hypothetical protein